jgi:hypothetical protein
MSISISLTEAPTTPQRTDPDNFRVLADQFVDWLANTFGDEMNTVITDFNATIQNLYVGTSTSSVAIGTGSKTFTMVESNLAFGVGTELRIAETADPTSNYMSGIVTAYNKTTKSLTVNVDTTNGSGTISAWTMTMEPREDYNRVRTWSSMTGAASTPLTVFHDSKYWGLLSALADVTAKEPGVDSEWAELTTTENYEEITTSQNWTPTVGATWALVLTIGAGGGGAWNNSATQGGAGGEGILKLFRISDLTTPVAITIGAGGAGGASVSADGTAGGNTTFGALVTAYGGQGGLSATKVFAATNRFAQFDPTTNPTITNYPSLTSFLMSSVFGYGGASGGSVEAGAGGETIFGGGGGGATTSGFRNGGVSHWGGDGGDGAADADGGDGTAPGGGGGSCYDTVTAGYVAGDGADGACRIWQW